MISSTTDIPPEGFCTIFSKKLGSHLKLPLSRISTLSKGLNSFGLNLLTETLDSSVGTLNLLQSRWSLEGKTKHSASFMF